MDKPISKCIVTCSSNLIRTRSNVKYSNYFLLYNKISRYYDLSFRNNDFLSRKYDFLFILKLSAFDPYTFSYYWKTNRNELNMQTYKFYNCSTGGYMDVPIVMVLHTWTCKKKKSHQHLHHPNVNSRLRHSHINKHFSTIQKSSVHIGLSLFWIVVYTLSNYHCKQCVRGSDKQLWYCDQLLSVLC